MIVPVRCFNCGKVLAHLWEPYLEKIQVATNVESLDKEKNTVIITEAKQKSIESKALDELGIERYCCRIAMLGTIDLTEDIVKTSYSRP